MKKIKNNMKLRQYKDTDYSIVGSWWVVQTGQIPSIELYNEKWSWVVENENQEPLACVSLLTTNSPEFAFFNSLVGNPEVKIKPVQFLLTELEKKAKELGYKRIISTVENENMIKYFQYKKYNLLKNNMSLLSKEF